MGAFKADVLKLRDGRLHLFRQPKSQNYFWRTFIDGKYLTRTTKTSNLALAKSLAENAYDKLHFTAVTPEGTRGHAWSVCEAGLIKSLQVDETRPSRLTSHRVKLKILRLFFETRIVESIRTKDIEDYIVWRKTVFKPSRENYHKGMVANKTLAADLLTLRQVLKFAKREQFIALVPDFPTISIIPHAKGWFTNDEWTNLRKVAMRWVTETDRPAEQQARQYVYDYMLFLVHTGMRVDEALCVRFDDVAPDPEDTKLCFITIRGGKLSYRMKPTECIGMVGAVNAIQRQRDARPDHLPADLVFPKNPRAQLHELLVLADLHKDERGERRTAKNFRHTFIMFRLLQGVDVFKLAKNCRTSVKMIEAHYGSYINARLSKKELTKFKGDDPIGKGGPP